MKDLITFLAVTLFSAGMNVSAQEVKPKETSKKESTAKEKKPVIIQKNLAVRQNL